ncbi:nucleotide disphospho-sugar-binding domain-containing protein [Streptomyces sp. NPDC053048]|uniref:nucleotide disphospho-sugar-binding domain-containing protein n=1 Tax=Streptomyces sp. NPDC053048 TaxID=3365694 RepID=UPI0037D059EE
MRVMFTVFPAPAHFLPVVHYAWALQSAGHDVCVATPPGYPSGVSVPDFHQVVNATGLKAVTCGDPEPLAVHDRAYPGFAGLLPTAAEGERYAAQLGIAPADREAWDVYYHFALLAIRDYHPPEPRQDVAAVVDFARAWQPDLVLWEPWFPCGAVAARVTGAAHARVLITPDYTGWAHERFAHARVPDPLETVMRPLAERYGVEVDDELLLGQWSIDPFPDGVGVSADVTTLRSRYVPYTGAGVMPQWLHARPERPRVALSLGVSARTFLKGDWGRTATLMDAVADLDAEVVATLNANQLADVPGPLPDNVRAFDYLPLDHLLPTCSAIVHHGSIGTLAAASTQGVPQLVCDTDEPARCFGTPTADGIAWDFPCEKQITATSVSSYVTRRGAGVRLNHQTQSPDEIRRELLRVLDGPSFQEGTERVRRDWLAAPSPAELVPALEKLTAEHRGGRARG